MSFMPPEARQVSDHYPTCYIPLYAPPLTDTYPEGDWLVATTGREVVQRGLFWAARTGQKAKLAEILLCGCTVDS